MMEKTENKENNILPLLGKDVMWLHYKLLAELFYYPDGNYRQKVKDAFNYLQENYPDAAKELNDFAEFASASTPEELQDLFLRSFDVQAITTLDIGYVLWGDDYKRGQLLVHLNREHREAGNIIVSELSDHLPNVLRLIPKIKNNEFRDELVSKLIAPAVEKMIGEFDPKKIKLKDKIYKKHLKAILDVSYQYRTIFAATLTALLNVLTKDFKTQITQQKDGGVEARANFNRHIETEMTIEK